MFAKKTFSVFAKKMSQAFANTFGLTGDAVNRYDRKRKYIYVHKYLTELTNYIKIYIFVYVYKIIYIIMYAYINICTYVKRRKDEIYIDCECKHICLFNMFSVRVIK